jgi:MoxR-like ATPase
MSEATAPTTPPPVTSRAIFQRDAAPHHRITERGDPPPWRNFAEPEKRTHDLGAKYRASDEEVRLVNAAIFLRRPLLVTGKPGTGKSTLAYAVAHQLGLGEVLVWPITSRSTLQQGLYHYDAVGRLQEASLAQTSRNSWFTSTKPPDIGRFIRIGPLGTALQASTELHPRVLLIDEIDKSDIDLPSDLLHVFEEGEFEIPELSRLPTDERFREITVGLHKGHGTAIIESGHVRCKGFPFVILTSNGEREFPPAFLRRCLRLDIAPPNPAELKEIVRQRLGINEAQETTVDELIKMFDVQRRQGEMATDQLLNAVYVVTSGNATLNAVEFEKTFLRSLTS